MTMANMASTMTTTILTTTMKLVMVVVTVSASERLVFGPKFLHNVVVVFVHDDDDEAISNSSHKRCDCNSCHGTSSSSANCQYYRIYTTDVDAAVVDVGVDDEQDDVVAVSY
jgi:hypothetical protein